MNRATDSNSEIGNQVEQSSASQIALIFLLILPLLAKFSFAFTGIVPSEFGVFVFQHGMHPFLNAGLVAMGAMILFIKNQSHLIHFEKFPKYYLLAIGVTLVLIGTQSLLQYFFGEEPGSLLVQLGAAGSTALMILVYGLIVPSHLHLETIESTVKKWGTAILFLSLLVAIILPSATYKGGRYIGLFKHIPHIVTAATLTSFLYYRNLWQSRRLGDFLVSFGGWTIGMVSIFMSGTRSSLGAALAGLVLSGFLFAAKTRAASFIKWSMGISMTIFLVFFGPSTYSWLEGIATGQVALAGREAQDGVQSRLEEVDRGLALFEKAPWLGLGLSSKFSQSEGAVDVSSYNSFKDPHNILISAGVIGGWPFLVWTIVLLCLLLGSLLYLLFFTAQSDEARIWQNYLVCHLPILVIYHWHLSIGGMADRFYWLAFGIVALSFKKKF